MPTSKRATLYDVAHRAGVSYQTVSRVINGNPHVSPQTLKRVQSAIRELDYQPNKAAQTLVTRRSYTIEIIILGADYYGPHQMMASVQRAAKGLGYKLIYSNVEDASPEHIRSLIENLGNVDGLIIITPVRGVIVDELLHLSQRPFVRIGTEHGASGASVIIDQRYGCQLATQYLIDLGHRHFAEISGPLNWFDASARHESWLSTLRTNQIDTSLSVAGDWTAEGGYHAAQALIGRRATFTALVVGNDQMALGAMRALREHQIRVPEDVSIIGFDDIPEAGYFEPPLTTVRQDFSALGKLGVEYLIDIIGEDVTSLQQHVLYPRLIVRHTTAAPQPS